MKVLDGPSEIVSIAPTGPLNSDTAAPTIAAPPVLQIGMLHGVLVVFGQATTASTIFTPAGMTRAKPSADAAQRGMEFYFRPIKTSADLAAAQSTLLRANAASTRIVAHSFAVAPSDGYGPNLDAPIAVVGSWRVTAADTVNNYFPPASPPANSIVVYGTYSNNAAGTTHPTHSSPWGVLHKQAMALSGSTASESDTVLSLATGGTNTTFSIAVANSGSFGVALAAVPVAVADRAPIVYLTVNGVRRSGRLRYIADALGRVRTIGGTSGLTPGGQPEQPGDAVPTEGLPFDASPILETFASDNLLFSHDFPPYPIGGINDFNTPDYYDRNYLSPTGESSAYINEGSLLRDRPIYTTAVGATDAEKRKYLQKVDLTRMGARGVDVSLSDLLGDTGRNSDYVNDRIQARHEMGLNPAIPLVAPMLDCTGTTAIAADGVARSAAYIARFYGKAGTWLLPDGRMGIAAFKVEDPRTPPSFWVSLTGLLRSSYGIEAAYLFSFNSYTADNINEIKSALVAAGYPNALYAVGPWGMSSDPALVASTSNFAAIATAAGLESFAPIQGQNDRPGDGVNATDSKVPAGEAANAPHGLFDEADGTGALRAQWNKNLSEGSRFVMEVTSNDYSEGGQFSPSLTFGYAKSSVSMYYAYKHKMGAFPKILRDDVVLVHRSHFSGVNSSAEISGAQTSFQRQWERGGTETPPQDNVETLTFLTAPATVEVTIGGVVQSYTAPAGLSSHKYPLALGRISARVVRSGSEVISVRSPVLVVSKPVIQNMLYFWFDALQGVSLQGDPTANKSLTMAADPQDPPPPISSATVASILNIGSAAGKNHYEVQTSYPGATAFTHTMTELINGYQRSPELLPSADGLSVEIRTSAAAEIMTGSSWPRNELRGVNKDGSKQAYNAKVGEHWQHQRGTLLALPPNKSEIVLAQLHNGASDRIALRIQKTNTPNNRPRLIWRVNGAEVYVFKDPILVGDSWRAAWRVGGPGVADGVVRLYDGDMSTPVYTSAASKLVATAGVNTWYDKAGNYLQTTDGHDPDNPTAFDASSAYGMVKLFDLRHGHSYWGETNALGYPFT